MQFKIPNRWTGAVSYTCKLTAEIAAMEYRFQLGFAIKSAVLSGADLGGADLYGADLGGADMRSAVLRGAALGGADLSNAVLRKADLRGAILRGADLRGADLHYADLRKADMRNAVLRGANLRNAVLRGTDMRYSEMGGADLSNSDLYGTDLRGADLYGAVLRKADLYGAILRGADLRGADLHYADLAIFKADFVAEALKLPAELDSLRATILAGRIDGSAYSGECRCFAGTLAKARFGADKPYDGESIYLDNFTFVADSRSPRERWFMLIKRGDTPETNRASNIALEWLDEAIAMRDNIRRMVDLCASK
jgi:uncharacterized protein YjbI with pentapeptide repeats